METLQIEVVRAKLKRQGSIAISFTVPFETICSVPKKPYGGTLSVSYVPTRDKEGYANLIEWNSFAKWVESLRAQMFLAEELAQLVAEVLFMKVVPEGLHVLLSVESAFHLPVEIEVSIP